MKIANVNGVIRSEQEATVSVFDHGFLFGEGVYETFRTYDRKPFLYDRHMRRLRRSAAIIDLPVPLSDDEILGRMRATMVACEGATEVYLRLMITRGVGELSYEPSPSESPTVVVIAKPFVPPPAKLYEEGVLVSVVSVGRGNPNAVSPLVKSNNLLVNALAMREALRRGAYEGLMLNHRGEITECSQSNFFIVKDGVAYTPPLESGLLSGITRELLLETTSESGVTIHQMILRTHELLDADEAFLTSTTREILPVVRVDGHRIGDGRPGPVTLRLLEFFRWKGRELTR